MIIPEHYFYLKEGGVLRDMSDMLNAFRSMNDEVFSYHVNAEKNDFSNWTKDILKDTVLAKRLVNAKTKEKMMIAIERRLKFMAKSKTKKRIIEQIKEAYTNE